MNHRRYNPLLGEWVLVAANRINRPWQGAKESKVKADISSVTNENNPLAPGGIRANGTITPNYDGTYVFQNDFPALTDDETSEETFTKSDANDLFKMQKAKGTCRVICYHPNTNLTMALMTVEQIEKVVDTWIRELNNLKRKYEWIQVFENKGKMMGCSNSHPHGQLWATSYLPNVPTKMYINQKKYTEQTGQIMLMEYLKKELEAKERIVTENENWTVLVPFWGFWPFETMLLPKRPLQSLFDIEDQEKKRLASILKILLVKYDNLFECSFPYCLGWYGAPTAKYLHEDTTFWTLHAVFYPPLLRSATVRKHVASYELLCEPQRDITPEKAAKMLRDSSDIHYSTASSSSIPISS